MTTSPQPPPPHVCAAFGARGSEPELIDGGPVWRCADTAIRPVAHPAEAAWVARTLDTLQVENIRLGHPLRSTDGRWVVGGWAATRYLPGRAEPRHDEVVAVSVRLHEATKGLLRPRFLDTRKGVFAVADRCAWGEDTVELPAAKGGRLFDVVAGLCRPVSLTRQVVHGDLFGNVLFEAGAPPALIDFVPYWRPAEWAAAVVVVDALAWGGADPGIIKRWEHLSEWPQVLVRALLFRLAAHALHPNSTARSLLGLERVTHQIIELV